tara:strand:+ start:29392 stop:29667 length:276 start_codon:yes stop_codon:yes gene_type:complete
MPTYVYAYLDKDGNPTDEHFETFQKMSDDALTKNPEDGRPCQRVICAPMVKHNGPAWEWCEETRKYINETKPKYIRDDEAGVRMKFPKGGV